MIRRVAELYQKKNDCMYAKAAPQHPAYSGISASSNAHTIPGTGDFYPGFYRSTFPSGTQQVSDTPILGNYQ